MDFHQREEVQDKFRYVETHSDAKKAGCSGRGGEVTVKWHNEDEYKWVNLH